MRNAKELYPYDDVQIMIECAKDAVTKPIERYGIQVFFECDPDIGGYDFKIDPLDLKGIEIAREFAAKMAEHYASLT